jgi:FdhD protein
VLARVALDGGTDEVAVELPLEIRVNGEAVAVTMRTPGHDFELGAGFLYGEGIVEAAPEMTLPDDLAANVVDALAPDARPPATRRFYTTSSCGICGKGALEEVEAIAPPVSGGPTLPRALLADLPERLRQPGFERTGGLHATGLFDASGEALLVREDVGRHNAMDKVIGHALIAGTLPLSENVLCVSGRLAFELVQKTARAGAPILVGVGAPTSLAVELAADRGITLAGFARGGRVNVYTHAERVR